MSRSSPSARPSFLSCDWGTSRLRLRLIDQASLTIIGETSSDDGIAATFAAWRKAAAGDRAEFFRQVLRRRITLVAAAVARSLDDIPLVISGMATSSLGMIELPYHPVPFAVDGSDLSTKTWPARPDFPHVVVLISGTSTTSDVMRGEETKLVGALATASAASGAGVLLFPGTHCKHIRVVDDRVTEFRTYMTGEFFDLLSRHSILAHSLADRPDAETGFDRETSAVGVRDGARENLLHAGFTIRARDLLGRGDRSTASDYLSGLLLGTELRDFAAAEPPEQITVVADAVLGTRYETALRVLEAPGPVVRCDADAALIAGQHRIALRLGLLR